MNIEEIKNLIGDFTWLWGDEFFIETENANFVWSDPNYDGDNTIRLISGSFRDYLRENNLDFGRSKGRHFISNYCGEKVQLQGE